MWVNGKRWVETDVERSLATERQLSLKCRRAIRNKEREGNKLTSMGGWVSKPVLKLGDRYMLVVLCILNLLMCTGKYLMLLIRRRAKKTQAGYAKEN